MSENKQPQKISTEGVEIHEEGGMSFSGREAVNLYAFTMLRRAIMFREKTGMSMLRGQECRMANNYGWSDCKRFNAKRLLADLAKVAEANGIELKD